jgi:hypothetical protein
MSELGHRAGTSSIGAVSQVISLEAVPESCRQARQFASDLTVQYGFELLVEEVSLCATELATNALLHTRGRFVLTVRPLELGIRLDVMDFNPERLPAMTPTAGSAVDLTTFGSSGRGLQIVAAVAARWGVFTTDQAKTVWAEVTAEPVTAPREPVIALGRSHTQREDLQTLLYLNIPVRAAVASGIQVEDLLREIHLEHGQFAHALPEIDWLFHLLDRSASIRLNGRHAALQAAAEGLTTFDLHIDASTDGLAALGELAPLLRDISSVLSVPVPTVGADVVEFREWLNGESVRQQSGAPPTPCSLPS